MASFRDEAFGLGGRMSHCQTEHGRGTSLNAKADSCLCRSQSVARAIIVQAWHAKVRTHG